MSIPKRACKFKIAELKVELRKRGLAMNGSKATLIKRLKNHLEGGNMKKSIHKAKKSGSSRCMQNSNSTRRKTTQKVGQAKGKKAKMTKNVSFGSGTTSVSKGKKRTHQGGFDLDTLPPMSKRPTLLRRQSTTVADLELDCYWNFKFKDEGDAKKKARMDHEKALARCLEGLPPTDFFQTVLKAIMLFHQAAKRARQKNNSDDGSEANKENKKKTPRLHQRLSLKQQVREGLKLLRQRLAHYGLRDIMMDGDGNCQFRSFSHEMYGTQRYHLQVRKKAVAYMRANKEDFSGFFVGNEFERYLQRMGRSKHWGDELTLRAIADCYGIKVHVITTNTENWYLKYEPKEWSTRRHVFLSYVAPVHYNTITLQSSSESWLPP